MKTCITFILAILCITKVFSQTSEQSIIQLIDAYSVARETNDTLLLESILHDDVDQLVSSGIWRKGKAAAKQGMLKSSAMNPGSRKLTIESVRFLNPITAIADVRYEISNVDGSERKMWSTFLTVFENNKWKITAIRNMLPSNY